MKRFNNIHVVLVLAVLFVSVSGCSKLDDFDDTNVDPTRVTVAATRAMLTNAIQHSIPVAAFGNSSGPAATTNTRSNGVANMYVQYLSEGPYPGGSLYNGLRFEYDTWYTGPLYNLQSIINYNADPEKMAVEADPINNGSHNNQIAVARIIKAFTYWHMTDRWGPIPYTEALKGAGNYTPAYTPQDVIYKDLFKELKEATAQIDNGEPPAGDIFLNGDLDAWKRFANTQRLIMALRLSKVDANLGKTEFAAALAAGVITSNNENFLYHYVGGDPNNYNPWYNNYTVTNRNDFAISETMVDYMKPLNDPRLEVYGEVLGARGVVGLEYGSDDATNIPAAFSRIGSYFRGDNSPAAIFTYAQVLLSMAEAAHLSWIPGGEVSAKKYYEDAIKASWEQYGVFDAVQFAAFISNPAVAYTPASSIEKILTQKWVHLYLNGSEAWAEWRRTGYPVLTPAPDYQSSQNAIPRRQAYPVSDATNNKANYDAAVTSLGGPDNLYTRIWWDKP